MDVEFPCLVLSGGFLELQLISSKSSSCIPAAASGTWPRWTRLSPSSGFMVQSGFVHTGTKGQLYLGRVFSWASRRRFFSFPA